MNWFRRLMIGRYGTDQLTWGLLALCLVWMVLARITHWGIFTMLAFATLAVCYLRMFSRDLSRRYEENQRFLRFLGPMHGKLGNLAQLTRDSRTHCHFRCPYCGQKIRVPRGRGKISISCPECHREFVKKT